MYADGPRGGGGGEEGEGEFEARGVLKNGAPVRGRERRCRTMALVILCNRLNNLQDVHLQLCVMLPSHVSICTSLPVSFVGRFLKCLKSIIHSIHTHCTSLRFKNKSSVAAR